MEGEQICMNMMFRPNKVQVSWERTELHDDEPPDWAGELSTTLNALHQGQEGIPANWEHEWEWIQKEEDYPRHDDDKKEVEIYYSDNESLLGAAEDDNDNDADENTSKYEEPKPSGDQTRRSGRTWAPTCRTLESQGQHWDFRGMRTRASTTPWPPPPDQQPVDAEPEVEEPPQEDECEVQVPPPEVRIEVLDPAVDDQGRRVGTEREGLGEPDPLVLAKSPIVLPAIQECIPGPRERAQAQDRDPLLTRVKDWVRRGIRPARLELDFGEASLKAYIKILPVLNLNPLPAEPDLEDLDILVKTDIQGTIQSKQYCVPEELIVPLITDLHLRLTHFGAEVVAIKMQYLVWFPRIWSRTRQVLMCCPGCIQKHNHQSDTRIAGCYYPREKGNVAGWTTARDGRRRTIHTGHPVQLQRILCGSPNQEQGT